jgi:hypothetical protein
MKAQKRRKTINAQKRAKELPQSGMSIGYGEIERAAQQLLRVCGTCEKTEVRCYCDFSWCIDGAAAIGGVVFVVAAVALLTGHNDIC